MFNKELYFNIPYDDMDIKRSSSHVHLPLNKSAKPIRWT